ncbi:MAG: RNA polymerase sigma factor [Rhodothermaceae bacterium]
MSEEILLIERARNGDMISFRNLVERNEKLVYYLAYDLIGNHFDAEDISQEVFLKVYNSLKKYRGDAKFSTWLYRITLNTCLTARRKKSFSAAKKQDSIDDYEDLATHSYQSDPERLAEREIIQKNVNRAMQKLSEKEKSVFILKNHNGLSFNEISEIMSVAVGTLKSLNFRALKKMRDELKDFREEKSGEEVKNEM